MIKVEREWNWKSGINPRHPVYKILTEKADELTEDIEEYIKKYKAFVSYDSRSEYGHAIWYSGKKNSKLVQEEFFNDKTARKIESKSDTIRDIISSYFLDGKEVYCIISADYKDYNTINIKTHAGKIIMSQRLKKGKQK